MQSAPSLTDWISAIAAAISAVIGLVLLWQLKLTVQQLKLSREQQDATVLWNRLSATFSFFPDAVFTEREERMGAALRAIGIDFFNRVDEPLTADEIQKINGNDAALSAVRAYVNILEDYALAVRVGVVDKNLAFAQLNNVVVSRHKFFRPWMQYFRNARQHPDVYIELEILAQDWANQNAEKRRIREDALLQAEQVARQAQDRAVALIRSTQGVRPQYGPESSGDGSTAR